MIHEKIIKRKCGKSVKIQISMYTESNRYTYIYYVSVYQKEKRKKLWKPTYKDDDYDYRGMSTENRKKFVEEANLKYVTNDEIYNAKLELWEMLKPKLGT